MNLENALLVRMAREVRINVRTTPAIKRDLEITADLRGLTVSALVNSVVVKAIREEKEREPAAFKQGEGKLPATVLKLPRATEKRKTG